MTVVYLNYYIAIIGTIWLSTNKWLMLNKIISVKYQCQQTYKSRVYPFKSVQQKTDVKLLLLHCNTWNHFNVCKKND